MVNGNFKQKEHLAKCVEIYLVLADILLSIQCLQKKEDTFLFFNLFLNGLFAVHLSRFDFIS